MSATLFTKVTMGGVWAWNFTSSRCGGLRAGCVEREVAADYPSLCRQLEPVSDLMHTDDSSRVRESLQESCIPNDEHHTLHSKQMRGERHERAQNPLQQITQIESVSTLSLNTPVPKLLSTYIEQYALLRTRERKMLDTTSSTGLASSAPGSPSRCRPPRRARAC
ncbi:hypothetical protein OH76DRAFT_1111932 [Lentinus brumalis]|uniref:Uncharacterized protein n=1 Tax=Lentinus brumalis TaxID=2498619 RepID=A0A371CVB7_9APHY|nr:hypothetical protein OH76DRAFT_1111932 [Polyporus brumalis]